MHKLFQYHCVQTSGKIVYNLWKARDLEICIQVDWQCTKYTEEKSNIIIVNFKKANAQTFSISLCTNIRKDHLQSLKGQRFGDLHTSRLTDSMTSRNTSFLRYLIPSPLQDTAFVRATGGLGAPTSSLCPSCVMYLTKRWYVITNAVKYMFCTCACYFMCRRPVSEYLYPRSWVYGLSHFS